jgi:phosphate transport system substrate-binding protein
MILCRLSFIAVFLCLAGTAQAADPVRVGGTGMGLALMRTAGDALEAARPEIKVQVLPSLGTSGGLRALAAGAIEVALATRPAGSEENANGIVTANCMTTALIFATSRRGDFNIASAELPTLYREADPRWPDGQPLKVILRARSGSENPYLVKVYPALEEAFAAAFRRPGIPVGATDQENADLAQRTSGSFAIATLLQLQSEHLNLRPIAIDGVTPTPETIGDGRYPLPLPVCLLIRQNAPQHVRDVAGYVATPDGRALVRQYGASMAP